MLKDYRTTLTDELGYYPTKDDKRINKQDTFKELEVLADQDRQGSYKGGWNEGVWETEYESANAAKKQLESTEQGTNIENLINELKALSEHSESNGRPAEQNEVETAPTSQWNQPLMIPPRDGKTYYNNHADNGRAEWNQAPPLMIPPRDGKTNYNNHADNGRAEWSPEQVPSLKIPQRGGKTYDGFNNNYEYNGRAEWNQAPPLSNIYLDNGRAEWNQEEQVPPSMNYNRGNVIYVETSPNWK